MAIKLELLKTACYFSKLDSASLMDISSLMFERQYSSGEVVLWEREETAIVYFVISGQLKLFTTSLEGREFIVRLVYGGDSINDDAMFIKEPNALSAMTLSPAVLYGLTYPDLNKILTGYPQVSLSMAEVLAARQRYLVRLAKELVFKNVTSRLSRLLLEREIISPAETDEVKITQQEMASMIGTVRELVSRSLRELEAMRAITLDHNQIIITDRNQLLELSRA